ncbi:hypothetical protein TeGR_g10972 [Tetraparma gracilis]|uniref:Uncharacterized protein n=1 Tax=Tetraparma gracilis TaxID=2962635 RepID=A0ABQ6MAY2_9STRA|nr:hypothetical protein TeGR_g10972 [Tetraparma gracilis]
MVNLTVPKHTPNAIVIRKSEYISRLDLTEVVIPEGIETIGKQAFQNCRNLKKVVLPSTLRFLGHACFRECVSLVEIKGLRMHTWLDPASRPCKHGLQISGAAFFGCASLQNTKNQLALHPLTHAAENSFHYCTLLQNAAKRQSKQCGGLTVAGSTPAVVDVLKAAGALADRRERERVEVLLCLKRIKADIELVGGEYSEEGRAHKRRRLEESDAGAGADGFLNGTRAREMMVEEALWRVVLEFV